MAKQVTINGYIVYETWKGDVSGKYAFQACPAIKDSTAYTQIPVCRHSLSFDLPEGFDPRPAQIASLEDLKQKVRADFAARITEIEAQISSLLAIENAA